MQKGVGVMCSVLQTAPVFPLSLSAPVILTGYAHCAQNKKYDYCACHELTGVSIGHGELNCSELLLVDVYVL